jgi:uncharacterized protein (DUF2336 family)
MSREFLPADMKNHVRSIRALQEVTEVPMQIARRNHHKPVTLSLMLLFAANLLHDGDIAPDGETIVDQVHRSL